MKKNVKITMVINAPTGIKPEELTMDDVWGTHDEDTYEITSRGMIVAKTNDICPIFGDQVPYKSVTVVCSRVQEDAVRYWLEYVHGGKCVSKTRNLPNSKIALRSDYMCW